MTTQFMNATPRRVAVIGCLRHLHCDAFEGFACEQTVDWILIVCQPVVVAIFENEPLAIIGCHRTDIHERLDAVQGQRAFISPDDSVDRIDQQDTFAEPGDDLLQLPPVHLLAKDSLIGNVTGHGAPLIG